MTPDLSARVAALEARLDALERRDTVLSDVVSLASRMRVRERSRDDLIDMALGALPELLRTQWPNLADEVKRRHAVLYGDDFGADMTDRAIEYMSAAPPPPAAASDVIERVRDYLRRALSDVDQDTSLFLVGEALRLLGDAP